MSTQTTNQTNSRRVELKNDVVSVKSIVGILALIISLAGAITFWTQYGGTANEPCWIAAILCIVAIMNLTAYYLGWHVFFVVTITFFWAAAPVFIAMTNGLRIANHIDSTHTVRVQLAGAILLLIGSPLSFICFPSELPMFAIGLDWIGLVIIAIFDIIAGIILADLGYATDSSRVFIILCIVTAAVFLQSLQLHYLSIILATLMIVSYIIPILPGGPNHTYTAGYAVAFAGAVITVINFCIVLAFLKVQVDRMVVVADGNGNKTVVADKVIVEKSNV